MGTNDESAVRRMTSRRKSEDHSIIAAITRRCPFCKGNRHLYDAMHLCTILKVTSPNPQFPVVPVPRQTRVK